MKIPSKGHEGARAGTGTQTQLFSLFPSSVLLLFVGRRALRTNKPLRKSSHSKWIKPFFLHTLCSIEQSMKQFRLRLYSRIIVIWSVYCTVQTLICVEKDRQDDYTWPLCVSFVWFRVWQNESMWHLSCHIRTSATTCVTISCLHPQTEENKTLATHESALKGEEYWHPILASLCQEVM